MTARGEIRRAAEFVGLSVERCTGANSDIFFDGEHRFLMEVRYHHNESVHSALWYDKTTDRDVKILRSSQSKRELVLEVIDSYYPKHKNLPEMINIKNLVDEVVDTGESIKITDDNGKPVAVILRYDTYQRLNLELARVG